VSKAVNPVIAKGETMVVKSETPKIIRGSHSIRKEYPDGRVEFETIWEELKRDVEQALAEYSLNPTSEVPAKPKKTRKKTK
jgi:hypothetical protein